MDEEGFQELYRRYNRPIYNFFANRGFSREESRDLVQETFLAAYSNHATFRGDAGPEGWLFGVATNVWRMAVRDRKRLKRDAEVVSMDSTIPGDPAQPTLEIADIDPENRQLEKCLADEQTHLLNAALAKLPEKMRLCVTLRLREDLKYREIAEVLRVSTNTVRSQLFAAREKLKSQLEDSYQDTLRGEME